MKTIGHLTRRQFLKHTGLAAAALWLATALSGADAPPESKPGSIKILTCNIRLPLEVDEKGGNGWAARRDLCAQIIRAQHPDVICLQECLGRQLDDLKERMPGFDSFGLGNQNSVFNPADGSLQPVASGGAFNPMNAILFARSRFTLVTAGGFWLSQTPHVAGSKSWDSARVRFVNWVHLKARDSGKELRVWNTHLDHLGQQAREQQAALIVEASQAYPDNLPQLFAGDFNADGENAAVKVVKDGGWRDTYAAVHGPTDPGFTFHGFLGPKYPAGKKKINGKIDWIFCRGPVRAVAAEVIRDEHADRYPSDHYFVSAVVML